MSGKQPFSKPPLSYEAQVQQLRDRGMIVEDPDAARFYLQHLNYYRLGAYWLPFEQSHEPHRFWEGTRIEGSVRSQWAYQIAHQHGPHAYLDTVYEMRPVAMQ